MTSRKTKYKIIFAHFCGGPLARMGSRGLVAFNRFIGPLRNRLQSLTKRHVHIQIWRPFAAISTKCKKKYDLPIKGCSGGIRATYENPYSKDLNIDAKLFCLLVSCCMAESFVEQSLAVSISQHINVLDTARLFLIQRGWSASFTLLCIASSRHSHV